MKNNKKKVLPLLLAGVLLLSAGAYGTRAYFTDSADQEVGIKLTLGDLEITSNTEVAWAYAPEKGNDDVLDSYDINDQLIVINKDNVTLTIPTDFSDSYELASKITVSNVRPGDAFTRKFTFKNTGSLTQKVEIDEVALEGPVPYTVAIDSISDGVSVGGDFILNPEDTVTYTIRISVSSGIEDGYNNTEVNEYLANYFGKFLVVSASQPNAN